MSERRGRCLLFGAAASIDCRGASPVVPTDPPQAEGNMSERRGRCLLFGAAASIDCRGASPVADTTDPPQAEGNMMRKRRETCASGGRLRFHLFLEFGPAVFGFRKFLRDLFELAMKFECFIGIRRLHQLFMHRFLLRIQGGNQLF